MPRVIYALMNGMTIEIELKNNYSKSLSYNPNIRAIFPFEGRGWEGVIWDKKLQIVNPK